MTEHECEIIEDEEVLEEEEAVDTLLTEMVDGLIEAGIDEDAHGWALPWNDLNDKQFSMLLDALDDPMVVSCVMENLRYVITRRLRECLEDRLGISS